MSHYGVLRNYRFPVAAEDIRGATLYGNDEEKLGKIDDVIFDHATGQINYAVVDTGGWLSSKKFIVPADRLRASSKHEDAFTSNLTKKQVEAFPPYKESDLESEENWAGYEDRYRAQWKADPVMHRAETDRNVTPTTQQMQGNISSLRAAGIETPREAAEHSGSATPEDVEAASEPTERIVPPGESSMMISTGPNGIGQRWDTFQERLRERRKEAVAECRSCAAAAGKGPETAPNLRKTG